jgi:hypothetical protein
MIFSLIRAVMFFSSVNAHHAGLNASHGRYASVQLSTIGDIENGPHLSSTVMEYQSVNTSLLDDDT